MNLKYLSLISSLLVLGIATQSFAMLLGRGETQDRQVLFTVSTLEKTESQAQNSLKASDNNEPSPQPAASQVAADASAQKQAGSSRKDASLPSHSSPPASSHKVREASITQHNRAVLNRIITLEVQAQPITPQQTDLTQEVALIGIDARMPAHNHGMTVKPQISQLDLGKWVVRGFKLHMDGLWVVSLTVKVDGKEEVVSFELNI